MNVRVNVARILQAMEAKQFKIVDVCALCGVNNKTLAKILRGEIAASYRCLLPSVERFTNSLSGGRNCPHT